MRFFLLLSTKIQLSSLTPIYLGSTSCSRFFYLPLDDSAPIVFASVAGYSPIVHQHSIRPDGLCWYLYSWPWDLSFANPFSCTNFQYLRACLIARWRLSITSLNRLKISAFPFLRLLGLKGVDGYSIVQYTLLSHSRCRPPYHGLIISLWSAMVLMAFLFTSHGILIPIHVSRQATTQHSSRVFPYLSTRHHQVHPTG